MSLDEASAVKTRHDPNDYSRYVTRYVSRYRNHFSNNRYDKAILEAKKVVELKPFVPDGHALEGDAHKSLGLTNFTEAVKAYRKVLAMDPTNEEIKSGLAEALAYVLSPFGDAWREPMWEKLSKDPRTSEFTKQDDFGDVMAGIKHAWDFHPNWQDERLIRSVGVLLSDSPEHGEADSPGLTLVSGSDTDTSYEKDTSEEEERIPEENDYALESSEDDTTQEDKMRDAETRGDEYFSSDLFEDAVKNYTIAISHAPDNRYKRDLFSKRSAAHKKDEKYEEALADAESALNLNPEWAQGHTCVAAAHYALGKKEFNEARACYVSANFHSDSYQFSDAADNLLHYTSSPLEDAFKGRDVLNVLRASNRTSGFMDDDDFNKLMKELCEHPRRIYLYVEDDKVIDALYVLLSKIGDEIKGRLPWFRNVQTLINRCTWKLRGHRDRYDLLMKRSGYYMHQNQYREALSDARSVIKLKPSRSEGHALMGAAHKGLGLQMFELAVQDYRRGLAIEPTSRAMKSMLADSLAHVLSPFGDSLGPNMWSKLSRSPRTSAFMKQEGFVQLMDKFLESPFTFNLKIKDVRVIEALLVLLSDQTGYHEMRMDSEADPEAQAAQVLEAKTKGDAHYQCGLQHFKDAVEAYKKAQAINPSKGQFKSALEELENYSWSPFADSLHVPDVLTKLNESPLTSEMMKDSAFVDLVKELHENPSLLHLHTSNSQLVHVLYVLLNGDKCVSKKRQSIEGMGENEQGEEAKRSKPGEARQGKSG